MIAGLKYSWDALPITVCTIWGLHGIHAHMDIAW